MARVYKATVTVNFWKRHTCMRCEAGFRYRVRRTLMGQGPNEQVARKNLDRAVAKALAGTVWNACPACGYVQPEMVGQRRAGWHLGALLIGLALMGILAGLGFGHVVPHAWVSWLALGVGGALAAVHLGLALRNPNSDLKANRAGLAAALADTRIVLEREAPAQAVPRGDAVGLTEARRPLALVAVLLALLAVGAAEGTRAAAGWPLNPGWYPGVLGPGDSGRHYLSEKIRSLKGYWTAQATVRVRNAEDVGLPYRAEMEARSKRDHWGANISAESSEERSRSTPWVDVRVLDRADLAGKELRLAVNLDVSYPRIVGTSSFEVARRNLTGETSLRLAERGAGKAYFVLWWAGLCGGGLLLAALGVLLRRGAKGLPASESLAISDTALAAEVLAAVAGQAAGQDEAQEPLTGGDAQRG